MSCQASAEVTKLVRQRSIGRSGSSIDGRIDIAPTAQRGCETTYAVIREAGSAIMMYGVTHIQQLLLVEAGVLGFANKC